MKMQLKDPGFSPGIEPAAKADEHKNENLKKSFWNLIC